MKRILSGLTIGVLLAGCGGGNGGGGSSTVPVVSGPSPTPSPTPTPTPAPTPAPTPPPVAGSQPTLLSLTADTGLEGFAGSNGYYRAPNGQVTYAQDLSVAATTPVRYNAATRSFTFTTFDYLVPNDKVTGPFSLTRDASASTSSFSDYTAQSNGISYRLTQLTPGASNTVLPLYYSSIAIARASYYDSAAGVTKFGLTPMAFGILFNWDTTKLTGAAKYSGIVLGHARGEGSRVYEVSGTVTIALNYDTTAFTGILKLVGKDDQTGEIVDLGTRALSQGRPRGVLDYFYANTDNDGQLQARLAGSLGEEFMGGFDAKIPDPRTPGAVLKVVLALAASK